MSGVIDDADELFPEVDSPENNGLKDYLLDSSEEFPLPNVDDFDVPVRGKPTQVAVDDDLSLPSIDDLMSSLPETPVPDSLRTHSRSMSTGQQEATQEDLASISSRSVAPESPVDPESSPLDLINSAHDMFDEMIGTGPQVLDAEIGDQSVDFGEASGEELSLPESSLQESMPKLVESDSFEASPSSAPPVPELDIRRTLSDAEYFEGESAAPTFTAPGAPPTNFEEGLSVARETIGANPNKPFDFNQAAGDSESSSLEGDSALADFADNETTIGVDIPEFKPAGAESRINNFSYQSDDEGFPVATPAMIQVPEDIIAPSAFDFDEAPEPLSTPRRVKLSRKHSGSDEPKFRTWIPVAGGALILATWLGSGAVLSRVMAGGSQPDVAMIVSSKPKAELFWGEESLGTTPVALREGQAGGDLQLRKEGYEAMSVPVGEVKVENPDAPVAKKSFRLQGLPVPVNWAGVPEGAKVWWDGSEAKTAAMKTVPAGQHTVKIKPTDGPSIQIPVTVPNSAELGAGKTFALGSKVSEALSKRPMLSLELKLPNGSSVSSVDLTVKGKGTKQTLTLSKGKSKKIAVSGPGEYTVSYGGGAGLTSFSTKVTAKAGTSVPATIALEKPTVYSAPVSQPSYTGSSSAPAYRPAPSYRPAYRPAPRPSYRPSGGGGGRIAPPAF